MKAFSFGKIFIITMILYCNLEQPQNTGFFKPLQPQLRLHQLQLSAFFSNINNCSITATPTTITIYPNNRRLSTQIQEKVQHYNQVQLLFDCTFLFPKGTHLLIFLNLALPLIKQCRQNETVTPNFNQTYFPKQIGINY